MLTIDITRALAIDGWMSELELVWLAEQAQKYNLIVEVGSYKGRSTRALVEHTLGTVYAMDDWKGPREIYISDRKTIFTEFCKNMDGYLNTDKLHLIIADHSDVYRHCPLQPDMVFIDGSHEYDDVVRDINFWEKHIQRYGLLCGHDIQFAAVKAAVQDLIPDYKVMDNGTIWYKQWQ